MRIPRFARVFIALCVGFFSSVVKLAGGKLQNAKLQTVAFTAFWSPVAEREVVLDCHQRHCPSCGSTMWNKYDNYRSVRTLNEVVQGRRCPQSTDGKTTLTIATVNNGDMVVMQKLSSQV